MVVPPKHAKMIIFSRKTHGCWVPPFRNPPNLFALSWESLNFLQVQAFSRCLDVYVFDKSCYVLGVGALHPSRRTFWWRFSECLKKAFWISAIMEPSIGPSVLLLQFCVFFFSNGAIGVSQLCQKKDPVRRKQIQRMHEVHYGKSGSYRWFVKPWTAFQEAEGKLLQVWSQIRMATLVPTSIYV